MFVRPAHDNRWGKLRARVQEAGLPSIAKLKAGAIVPSELRVVVSRLYERGDAAGSARGGDQRGAILLEQNDEWAVTGHYMSQETSWALQ